MLQALIAPVTGILDKFIEDKDAKNAMAHEIATMAEKAAHEAAMAQVEVNKMEAGHKNLFVSGWRPSVGWTCSLAMLWHFLLQPIVVFAATVAGVELPPLPEFDMDTLMTVLMGLLGLGGLRTYEKQKGLTK